MPELDENGNPIVVDDGSPKENMIPQSRFDEVYGQVKTLEKEIATLKDAKSEGKFDDKQKAELEAKTYLKNLLKETLTEEEQKKKENEVQEQKQFETEVKDLLSLNPNVKKEEFLKFLEEEGDNFASTPAAMKVYKKLNDTAKEASEKTKKDIQAKPKLPSNEGGGSGIDYAVEDKGKTMRQITEEAIKGLNK